jgi:xylulose-5-phosphate/fructose-6-phosphate phosphoketolase
VRTDLKPRLLGHFGTTPGLNFIYVHLNRVIKARDLDVIYICGPGHGGPGHGSPGMVANTWLEGTYGELYPSILQNAEGMRRQACRYAMSPLVRRRSSDRLSAPAPAC